ncbi:hypothetical protein DPMN_020468 [Dreissena polymorpha]|uniref:Uncharacterized protein n=1 Tax=Dreissena polymorpha TaxID=45954 RepID=A0A9D4NMN1_DREPO|nr:hypothetical protein DPMN_020468 [Dreissena polymorpha]
MKKEGLSFHPLLVDVSKARYVCVNDINKLVNINIPPRTTFITLSMVMTYNLRMSMVHAFTFRNAP